MCFTLRAKKKELEQDIAKLEKKLEKVNAKIAKKELKKQERLSKKNDLNNDELNIESNLDSNVNENLQIKSSVETVTDDTCNQNAKTTEVKIDNIESQPKSVASANNLKSSKKSDNSVDKPKRARYYVLFDEEKNKWIIKKSGAGRLIASFVSKEEATKRAKELSRSNGTSYSVQRKDGKFGKQ